MESIENILSDVIGKYKLEHLSDSVGKSALYRIGQKFNGKKPSSDELKEALKVFASENERSTYRRLYEDSGILKETSRRLN
jgi:hypothetical protein